MSTSEATTQPQATPPVDKASLRLDQLLRAEHLAKKTATTPKIDPGVAERKQAEQLEHLARLEAKLDASSKPTEPEPEQPWRAIGVQAVSREGHQGFARAGRFWPSSAPTFVMASPEAYAELRGTSGMLTVFEIGETMPPDEVAQLPRIDVPEFRRGRGFVPSRDASADAEEQLSSATEALDLQRALYEHLGERIAALEPQVDEAKRALKKEWDKYSPETKGSLANIEKAKCHHDALDHQLSSARTQRDFVSTHKIPKAEQAHALALSAAWATRHGISAWRLKNQERLARHTRLLAEVSELNSEMLTGLEVFEIPGEVVAEAARLGVQAPSPATAVAVGVELSAAVATCKQHWALRAATATTREEKRAAMKPHLDAIVERLEAVAGVSDETPKAERVQRLRIAIRNPVFSVAEQSELDAELEARAAEEAEQNRRPTVQTRVTAI
jgi:hypothetical protein